MGPSSVLAWEMQVGSEMLTATLPMAGRHGRTQRDGVRGARQGADGWGAHQVRRPGDSLVFVAHTGDDTDDQFRARMLQAKDALEAAGVRTGNLAFGQAEMTEIDRDSYQQFIDGAVRGKTA